MKQSVPPNDASMLPVSPGEIDGLRALLAERDSRLADKDATITDLRRRLDDVHADHRQALDRLTAAQERITALLTDQRSTAPVPARRSWWLWGKRR